MTTGKWSCLISFAWAQLTFWEGGGSDKFNKTYMFLAGFEPTPRQSKTGKSAL